MHEPVLELFLTAEWAHDILAEGDTPQLREDLFKLCRAYYEAGWDDCAYAAQENALALSKEWDYSE
jgi:hypothetical protein